MKCTDYAINTDHKTLHIKCKLLYLFANNEIKGKKKKRKIDQKDDDKSLAWIGVHLSHQIGIEENEKMNFSFNNSIVAKMTAARHNNNTCDPQ